MTDIATGKVYFTNGTFGGAVADSPNYTNIRGDGYYYTTITGGTTVVLDHKDVEDIIGKLLTEIQKPISRGNQELSASLTWLLDLKRIKRSIKITAVIKSDADGTMITKKNNILSLIGVGVGGGGTFKVLFGGPSSATQEYYMGNIDKITIKKSATGPRYVDATTRDNALEITINFVIGANR